MKNFSILTAAIICLVDLVSCETASWRPPPVTAELARTASRQHVRQATNPSDWRIDLVTLRQGRTLFVSRCIECHTLPAVAQHSAAQWPGLIDEMADRANLKPAERKAVLAYILAARAQLPRRPMGDATHAWPLAPPRRASHSETATGFCTTF